MSAESDLYAALTADVALAALVAERIYPDAIPQDEPLPAVAFVARAEPEFGLDNTLLATRTVASIGCWGATRTSASAVAEAVKAVLVAQGLTWTGPESGFDPEVGAYSATIETDIWS